MTLTMRSTLTLTVLLTAAAADVAPSNAGADDLQTRGKILHEADFKRSAKEMTDCAGTMMKLLYPDVHLFGGTAGAAQFVAGSPKNDIDASTWVVVATDKGNRTSDVKVLDLGASAQELDDAWGLLKPCETQK